MSDDLVGRLRAAAQSPENGKFLDALLAEAAEEIAEFRLVVGGDAYDTMKSALATRLERDALLDQLAEARKALKEAANLADLAETLTGCRADDDYVWSVQQTIAAALSPSNTELKA
jgi:hypothetical protein